MHTSRTVAKVSPSLYGLMTEEINYSYDGGLYAELVGNRPFARGEKRGEWTVVAKGDAGASLSYEQTGGPSQALPRYGRLTLAAAQPGAEAGVANAGYWGMAISPATTYRGSFWATTEQARQATARLVDDMTGRVLAEAKIALDGGGGWHNYKYELKTAAGFAAGSERHPELLFDRPGVVGLQLISLFPPTYADRPNGNRIDLMRMLAAMKPTFLRFPGGNYLEGDTIKERFNWKETIGPWVDRPTHRSPWGYQSTDGMGLLEFLEWTEDLHMAPVLAVYAGYSLHGEHVLGRELEPFIQDALDETEYVTGDANTKWGAVRAKDGHPAPFAVQYIEIGNEDLPDIEAFVAPELSRALPFDTACAGVLTCVRLRRWIGVLVLMRERCTRVEDRAFSLTTVLVKIHSLPTLHTCAPASRSDLCFE